MLKIGVIGAGSLGTALSQILAVNGNHVDLYVRRKLISLEINKSHYNSDYYPNVKLNDKIIATSNLNTLSKCDLIFLCIPSSEIRVIMDKLIKLDSKNFIIVSTIKGIEKSSIKRMSEIIREYTGKYPVVLSRPNIAKEIILNLPTITTIASEDNYAIDLTEKALSSKEFKVQKNNDIVGTELCGIIKNILAISLGICEGLGVNNNAKFAILNKGFNETKNIIEILGGNRETVDDYCGFGDIVTASTLTVSRNHTLGVFYGQKIVVDEKSSRIVFEGKNAVEVISSLCLKNNIESIIVDFVYNALIKKMNPEKAFQMLWDEID